MNMTSGQAVRLTLHGSDNETLEGVFILPLPAPNTTVEEEEPYDEQGAMTYAVVVILVYGCSIIFLIASHIFFKRKDGKKDQDDGQIDKYLQQVPSLKEKSARDSFRKLKYSIIPLVAMGAVGLSSSSSSSTTPTSPTGPVQSGASRRESLASGSKTPGSPLPSIAEADETDDPNQPLLASSSPLRSTLTSPVDEGKSPWEVDEQRRSSSPRTPSRTPPPSPNTPSSCSSRHPLLSLSPSPSPSTSGFQAPVTRTVRASIEEVPDSPPRTPSRRYLSPSDVDPVTRSSLTFSRKRPTPIILQGAGPGAQASRSPGLYPSSIQGQSVGSGAETTRLSPRQYSGLIQMQDMGDRTQVPRYPSKRYSSPTQFQGAGPGDHDSRTSSGCFPSPTQLQELERGLPSQSSPQGAGAFSFRPITCTSGSSGNSSSDEVSSSREHSPEVEELMHVTVL